MVKALSIASLVLVVVFTAPSRGAQDGQFHLYGPTGISCGAFNASPQQERQLYDWWLLGFVSGAGYSRSDEIRLNTDPPAIKAWTAKYCADHPLDPFAKAAIELVKELAKRGR